MLRIRRCLASSSGTLRIIGSYGGEEELGKGEILESKSGGDGSEKEFGRGEMLET